MVDTLIFILTCILNPAWACREIGKNLRRDRHRLKNWWNAG